MLQGQIGIGVDQAGGQPRSHIRAGEVGFRLPCRFLRMAAEIIVLRRSYIPPGAGRYGLHRFPALSRRKGCIHQRHKIGLIEQSAGNRFCRGVSPLLPCPAGVNGLLCIGGDGPGFPYPLRTGYTSLCAVLIYSPLRHTPFFRRFSERKITFHAVTAFISADYFLLIFDSCLLSDSYVCIIRLSNT